jgi:hypothetical protein
MAISMRTDCAGILVQLVTRETVSFRRIVLIINNLWP